MENKNTEVVYSLIGAYGTKKEYKFELDNVSEYYDLIEFADTRLEKVIAETGFKFKRLDATTYKAYDTVPTENRDNKGKRIYEKQLITVEELDNMFETTSNVLVTEFLNLK